MVGYINSFKWLVFVLETEFTLCGIQIEFLCIILISFYLQMVINFMKLIFCPGVLTSVQVRKMYNKYFTHFTKRVYVVYFCTVASSSKWKFKKYILCAVHDGLETGN
jgi:hypothetical protein